MNLGIERVQSKIKADVAAILQKELKDPRGGAMVTVTGCELSSDYRHCKVFVSILASSPGEERKTFRMLQDATGYVQRRVGGNLRTRVTPQLEFVLDKGAEQSIKIGSLLDAIRREREEREAARAATEAEQGSAPAAGPEATEA
ncbi:MAG: 30S ribosome-binding factor RbfA [Planctomycetota bacterium]|nr:MAG: 30S ribosome-binding factor RbfA [Planctomycetota bacterium]